MLFVKAIPGVQGALAGSPWDLSVDVLSARAYLDGYGLSCDAIANAVTLGASSVRAALARSRATLLECLSAGLGGRA